MQNLSKDVLDSISEYHQAFGGKMQGKQQEPMGLKGCASVQHPQHYNVGIIEVWDFIHDQRLDFFTGNVLKYVCRAGRKSECTKLQDLMKAREYLDKLIRLESGGQVVFAAEEDADGEGPEARDSRRGRS